MLSGQIRFDFMCSRFSE